MTKAKEETATEKFKLQKRPLNKTQMRILAKRLTLQVFQPKVDAIFESYQKEAVKLIESELKPKIEEYNTHVKPAIKPIQKRLKSSRFNDDIIQSIASMSVEGACPKSKYESKKEFGAFNIRGYIDYDIRKEMELMDFCLYKDLASPSSGFDVSSLKIPATMPRLMDCSIECGYNYWIHLGKDQSIVDKMFDYGESYKLIVKEAMQACLDFNAVIGALKKPEEIYITLPNSLPFLPKEAAKKVKTTATSLIASGEAERLNNLLDKAS